uniref:UBA domain-containing protein n=1 Tax=Trichuris muris TaxID=70415 RepID=A0A5S6QAN7_TRIMR
MGKQNDAGDVAKQNSKRPTTEELRLAEMLNDSSQAEALILQKIVRQIVELTGCDEGDAVVALHDADNDFEKAVDRLLEGDKQGEWIVKEVRKNRRRTHIATGSSNGIASQGNNVKTSQTAADEKAGPVNSSLPLKDMPANGIHQRGGPGGRRSRGRGRPLSGFGRGGERNESTSRRSVRERAVSRISGGRRRPVDGRGRRFGGRRTTFHSRGRSDDQFNAWEARMSLSSGQSRMDIWRSPNNTWDNSMAEGVSLRSPPDAEVSEDKLNLWTYDDWTEVEQEEWLHGPKEFTASRGVHKESVSSDDVHTFAHVVEPSKIVSTGSSKFQQEGERSHPPYATSQVVDGRAKGTYPSTEQALWDKEATDVLKNELGIGKTPESLTQVRFNRLHEELSNMRVNDILARQQRPVGQMPNNYVGNMENKLQDMKIGSHTGSIGPSAPTPKLMDYRTSQGCQGSVTEIRTSQSGGVLIGPQRPASVETAGAYGTAPSPVQSNAVAPSPVVPGVGSSLLSTTKVRPEVSGVSTSFQGVSKSEQETPNLQKGAPLNCPSQFDWKINGHVYTGSSINGGYPLTDAPSTNSSPSVRSVGNVAPCHTQMIDGCVRQTSMPLLLNQYNNAADPNAIGYKTFTGSNGANRPPHYQTTSAPFSPLAAYQPAAIPPGLSPYMGLYDQMNLNSLGYFSAPNLVFNNAFDINSLNQLPPSMAASSLASGRDIGGEFKSPVGRIDSNSLAGMSNVTVPTPQGPHAAAFAGSTGTNSAAAQQAAALMGLGPFPPFPVMTQLQHPYAFPPFVMPTMSNTAASTVATSVAPKPGISPFSQAMYNPAVYEDLLGASDCGRGYGFAGVKSATVPGIGHQHQTVAGVQHPGEGGQKTFGGSKMIPRRKY